MGKLRNTLDQFRHGFPKMDFIRNKHKDCTNFDTGNCIAAPRIFNLANLNPKGQACPHFKVKKIAFAQKNNNLEK